MPVKQPELCIYPGQKICKLTVLAPAGEGKFGSQNWKVRCDCGRELIASENSLRTHNIRSCGVCTEDKRDKDFIGHEFGMLTVNRRDKNDPYGKAMYECTCDCGNHRIMRREFLRKKPFPNCGCYNPILQAEPNIKHGLEGNPLTRIWRAMKQRCENPECDHYYLYGARGIKICDRWRGENGLQNFVKDMYPSYKKGLQIDRIDNDGDYEPDNCRWVTRKENSRNKRSNHLVSTVIGTKTIAEQSEVSGVPTWTIRHRLEESVPEEMSIIPNKPGNWLHPKELQKLDRGEAIWMDTKAGREAIRVVETAEVQAEAIKDWGFGPVEIILGN